MLYRYFKSPKTRIMANLQSIAYALIQGDGITLGNRCFLGDPGAAEIVEVPVTEMQNDRYEETVAYTTEDMSTMKELFLDYVQKKKKK